MDWTGPFKFKPTRLLLSKKVRRKRKSGPIHQRSNRLDRTIRVQTNRIIVVREKFVENEEKWTILHSGQTIGMSFAPIQNKVWKWWSVEVPCVALR
jgi:hypothetical protein